MIKLNTTKKYLFYAVLFLLNALIVTIIPYNISSTMTASIFFLIFILEDFIINLLVKNKLIKFI